MINLWTINPYYWLLLLLYIPILYLLIYLLGLIPILYVDISPTWVPSPCVNTNILSYNFICAVEASSGPYCLTADIMMGLSSIPWLNMEREGGGDGWGADDGVSCYQLLCYGAVAFTRPRERRGGPPLLGAIWVKWRSVAASWRAQSGVAPLRCTLRYAAPHCQWVVWSATPLCQWVIWSATPLCQWVIWSATLLCHCAPLRVTILSTYSLSFSINFKELNYTET